MKTLKRNLAVFLCIVILLTTPMVATSCAGGSGAVGVLVGAAVLVALIWYLADQVEDDYYYTYACAVNTVGPIASDETIVSLFNETNEPWEFYLDGKSMGTIEPGEPVDFILLEGNHEAYFTTNGVIHPPISEKAFIVPEQNCSVVLRPVESAAR